ncbi:hypothetical protein B0T18DRAFT_385172 [Schizothecium vesticola]|uniref:AAA+ ATPase domain-containing protein n=1 Tax=Schizothecium vesticola TaxID=314040 RepID=A0AA40F885_9PEZI|nr:hypothetical protein B0T18DRAFT_385172 [Schizothecium vesticola]
MASASASACEMQDSDNPPLSSPQSRRDSNPSVEPSTESRASTPATSVDTPLEKQGNDHDHDGTATPRHPLARSEPDKMQEQLRMLQEKLAHLEKQSSLERHARQQIEQQLANGLVPMASAALTEAIASQTFPRAIADDAENYTGEIREEMGLKNFKSLKNDPSVSRYAAVTVSLLETQLERMKRDRDNINKLEEDRNRLRDMQTLWEREREEMTKQIKQQQAAQAAADGQPAADAADVTISGCPGTDQTELPTDGNSAVPVPDIPVETAKLNHVTWEDWRLCHLKPNGYSCALDVLDGEPDVSFERPVYYDYWQTAKTVKAAAAAKQRLNIVPKANPDIVPGQAPIAERIRINSKHILRILSKIHGEDISQDDLPLVMIRPFKGLNYYDKAIRQKLLELKAKFGPKDDQPPGTPMTETTPKEIDTVLPKEADTALANAVSKAAGEKGESKTEPEEENNEWTLSLTAYEHLSCLVQFMDEQIEEKISYLEKGQFNQISFTDIWYLFRPGVEVVDQTLRQAYRVVNVSSPGHILFPPWRTRFDKAAKAKEETPVILVCVYIDFDGKNLGPGVRRIRIPRYDGEKAVTSLDVFPLRFAEQRMSVQAQAASSKNRDGQANIPLRDRLIARGKLFMDMTGFKHMHYNGLTLDTRDEVDSNVVVDFQEAFSYFQSQKRTQQEQPGFKKRSSSPPDQWQDEAKMPSSPMSDKWQPELKNIVDEDLDAGFEDEVCTAGCCRIVREQYHKDSYGESKRNRDYIRRLMPEGRGEPPPSIYVRPLQEIRAQEEPLIDDDFLIMSYRVFAFVLRSRKWAQLDLTHLKPPDTHSSKTRLGMGGGRRQAKKRAINDKKRTAHAEEGQDYDSDQDTDPEDDTAFGQLVLPAGHKKMVKSLVAQHFRDKESKEGKQVDLVSGKGKGLILLLHGAPGVGKTTTAEGVAEKFQKPLYQITCGDLGTTAPEVEKALETSFSLASRWGSVLLLDEADVFLAARSRIDFKRNGLVSVFLRVLEYYTGVLFLTTNRIGDFDEAFASRIHISLYYPQLDLNKTLEIFELNLDGIESRLLEKDSSNNSKSDIRIDRDEILAFAEAYFINPAHKDAKWNGRQIRNACQTALALAEFRAHERRTHKANHAASEMAVHLKVKDFKTVADAYLEFINYLNTLHGFDAEQVANKKGIRAQDVEVLKRMVERFEQDKAEKKAAADKEKEVHTASMNPPPQTPSATTGAAAQADSSTYSHPQSYGGGGGGGGGVGAPSIPPAAAAISPASQPIPPAQAPTGAAPPMAPPPTYAQPGYYNYGPPGGGGYGQPQPPQGAPMYNPWYQHQQQQPPYGGAPQPPYGGAPQPPYGGAPQPPTNQAPPPNSQQYYQSQPPPGTGEGPQGQPPPRA